MLSEGIADYFDDFKNRSRDRILRAHLISESSRNLDLAELTAAWLAHIAFNRSDYVEMGKMLKRSLATDANHSTSALLRSSLVVADAYMHCGDFSAGRRWYEKTRLLAVEYGDEASISAIIYNRAALGLALLRRRSATTPVASESARSILLEVDSAQNFYSGTRNASFMQLLNACRARALLFNGRCEEALPIFKRLLDDHDLSLGLQSDRLVFEVEHIQCLLAASCIEEARAALIAIDPTRSALLSVDDRYVFWALFSKLNDCLGLVLNGTDFLQRRDACQREMEQELNLLKSRLDGLATVE